MASNPVRRIVQDAGTLKALADPTRLSLLELMMADHTRAFTAKELATAVGVPATKIYYHLNNLEQHELIQIRFTRMVNGIVEKHYGAGQQRLTFQRGTDRPADPSDDVNQIISTMIDQVRTDIECGLRAGTLVPSQTAPPETRVMVSQAISNIVPARAAEFREQLFALVERFRADFTPDAPSYQLLVAIHPHTRPDPSA